MANLPSPIVVGGGGSQQLNFLEQLLLTIASQSPQMLMQHLARKDVQRTEAAKNEAAMPVIQQLMATAANDPTLLPVAQSIGAFWQQPADVQARSAAGFADMSQQMIGTIQQRAESKSREALALEQASAVKGAESRAQELHEPVMSKARSEATTAEVEAAWSEYMADLKGRQGEANIRLTDAQTEAALREAQQFGMNITLATRRLEAELEAMERETFAAQLETFTQIPGTSPAAARVGASLLAYGTPVPPSLAEIRADAQARARGEQTNLFATIRQRLLDAAAAAGAPLTPQVADQLDIALERFGGNGQAVMQSIVDSGQVPPQEYALAAAYLTAATRTRVVIPDPTPESGVWLQRMFEGIQAGFMRRPFPTIKPPNFEQVLDSIGVKPRP